VVYSGQPKKLWANDEITPRYLIITSLLGCRLPAIGVRGCRLEKRCYIRSQVIRIAGAE
jgi:hypothetical protein